MYYLKKPKAVWKRPVKSVAVKTKCRYNVGLSLGDTFAPIVSAISNDEAATVPTARCFELPKTAYINGGTKLESASSVTKKKHER